MPRVVSIRQTVDRFAIGRGRALVRENMWYIFWGNRRCGLRYVALLPSQDGHFDSESAIWADVKWKTNSNAEPMSRIAMSESPD